MKSLAAVLGMFACAIVLALGLGFASQMCACSEGETEPAVVVDAAPVTDAGLADDVVVTDDAVVPTIDAAQ